MKPKSVLLLIIILAAVLRFLYLGTVPTGITHDEMGYIYNAYSIAKTGRNVFGELLPVFTWMTRGGFPFMPVPIYSMVPLFWVLPLTPTVARLLPAILGTFDVVLLFFIIQLLFKNRALALLSAFFLAISPWHLHFARSAYDANYALFYFLLAIVSFLFALRKNWMPWIAILAFIAGIFSYRGMSILVFPVALALYWYARSTRSINPRQSVAYWAGITVCFILLILPIVRYPQAYTAEGMQLFQNPKMQEDLDTTIRQAQGPLSIRRFFANKPTYIINKFRENYLKIYSPEFLFLYTEPSAIYSIWSRGRIYFIDVFFIMLGIVFLHKLNKKSSWVWYSLILIGGLPGGIGGQPYSSRSFLLSSIFPVLSAAGVLQLVTLSRKKILRVAAIILVSILYIYALGSYLYDYYYRYAYQGAEGWAKSIKEISVLAKKKQSAYDLIFLGRTSFADTVEYAFWNNLNPQKVQKAWENRNSSPFTYFLLDNVVFGEKCLDRKDIRDSMFQDVTTMYYITAHTCNNEATPSAKIEDYFGNPIWKLFEFDRNHPDTFTNL